MVGAWVEAIVNIVVSLILVFNFGLVGVAIGTLVAMSIRTIELLYHSSKHILNRSIWYTFKIIPVICIEVLVCLLIFNIIPKIEITNYLTWAIQAIITAIISGIVIFTINCIIYKDNAKNLIKLVKNIFKKEK